MLVVNLTTGNTTASTAIPISQVLNTNNNLNINNSNVQVLIPGIYEIVGEATITSSATGDYGIGVYANNELQGSASISEATAASESSTIPIYSIVNIKETSVLGYATINFMPVGVPAIVGGTISIKMIS